MIISVPTVPAFLVVVALTVSAKLRERRRVESTQFGVGVLIANALCALWFGVFLRIVYRDVAAGAEGLGFFAYMPAAGLLVALYGMKVAWSIANGSHLQDEREDAGPRDRK
jgi:hypothetical protein